MGIKFHKISTYSANIYGGGLFVCKDDNGRDCHVGDRVKVTRCAASWDFTDNSGYTTTYELEERSWEGILIFRKSTGVWVKTDNKTYIRPKFNRSWIKWKWELIT